LRIGSVQQFGSLLGGVLFFIIGNVFSGNTTVGLQVFSISFAVLLALQLLTSANLFKEYKRHLQKLLYQKSREIEWDNSRETYGLELVKRKLKKFNKDIFGITVLILIETFPRMLVRYFQDITEKCDKTIVFAFLHSINPTWNKDDVDRISKIGKKIDNQEIKQEIEKVVTLYYDESYKKLKDLPRFVDEWTPSLHVYQCIQYLKDNEHPNEVSFVKSLLRSRNHSLRMAGVELAERKYTPEYKSILISNLKTASCFYLTQNLLLERGDNITDELFELFKSTQDAVVLMRIVETMAKIGSPQIHSFLVLQLSYPNEEVQDSIVKALYFSRYEVVLEDDKPPIIQKLDETIGHISYLWACLRDFENTQNTLKISHSIEMQLDNKFDILFKLLAFLFNFQVVKLIKKNVNNENTIYALEIIDTFISKDIKYKIVPLFEERSLTARLKGLNRRYPQQKMSLDVRLKDIIVADYTKVDDWSKVKAIELLAKLHKKQQVKQVSTQEQEIPDVVQWTYENVKQLLLALRKSELPEEIFACLYHADEIIYSTAASVLYEENPVYCIRHLRSMSSEKQNLISLLENKDVIGIVSEKVRFLKGNPSFFNIPENFLARLSKIFSIRTVTENDRIYIYDDNFDEIAMFISSGKIMCTDEQGATKLFKSGDMLLKGINIPESVEFLVATKKSVIMITKRSTFFNVFLDDTEVLKYFLDS